MYNYLKLICCNLTSICYIIIEKALDYKHWSQLFESDLKALY